MSDIEKLRDLIGDYWEIAYKEGEEGRTYDTTDGVAAACWREIERTITRLEERIRYSIDTRGKTPDS